MAIKVGHLLENQKTVQVVILSRFTVEFKGDGLGTNMFNALQKKYKEITLWSNPEAKGFYTRHGVNFSAMR